jgi:hypothetical protein
MLSGLRAFPCNPWRVEALSGHWCSKSHFKNFRNPGLKSRAIVTGFFYKSGLKSGACFFLHFSLSPINFPTFYLKTYACSKITLARINIGIFPYMPFFIRLPCNCVVRVLRLYFCNYKMQYASNASLASLRYAF